MKSFGPKKIKFHAWVKKCHFGNFTRNRLIGWIGHALLVQPSKTAHRIFFSLLYLIFLYFFRYETIVRSSAWCFGHSDPDPSSVFSMNCSSAIVFLPNCDEAETTVKNSNFRIPKWFQNDPKLDPKMFLKRPQSCSLMCR